MASVHRVYPGSPPRRKAALMDHCSVSCKLSSYLLVGAKPVCNLYQHLCFALLFEVLQ